MQSRQAKEQRAREQRAAEQRAMEQQASEQRANEDRAKEQQAAEQRAKEKQVRDQQEARDRQMKEQQAREQQEARDRHVKEQQAREQRAKEQKAREQQEARDRQAKEQQAAEQRAKEQEAREQQSKQQEATGRALEKAGVGVRTNATPKQFKSGNGLEKLDLLSDIMRLKEELKEARQGLSVWAPATPLHTRARCSMYPFRGNTEANRTGCKDCVCPVCNTELGKVGFLLKRFPIYFLFFLFIMTNLFIYSLSTSVQVLDWLDPFSLQSLIRERGRELVSFSARIVSFGHST